MENTQKLFIVILVLLILYIYIDGNNNIENTMPEMKIVPPQFVFNALSNDEEKILLVNTLSDKENMNYKITLNGKNDERSLSKQQFEDFLLENNNKIPDNIDRIILYCASWSCNGAKNYYKELFDRKINLEKVVDYVGSIHEWASYSKIFPSTFTFHNNDNNRQLIFTQINQIFENTAHNYFIDNVMTDQYLKVNSNDGKILFT